MTLVAWPGHKLPTCHWFYTIAFNIFHVNVILHKYDIEMSVKHLLYFMNNTGNNK